MPGVTAEMFPTIAEHLGITIPHVWDLSTHSDEIASTLSIRQIHKLSLLTGVGIADLIGLETTEEPVPITFDEFCAAIRSRISADFSGIMEFEEAIGWKVREFLDDPGRLYDVANWDCLRDVAASVGIDPAAVLPHDNQASEQVMRGNRRQRL